jgi:hypothetical protein
MAGGMVTWPLPVIFTQTLWLRLVPKVNRRPVLSLRIPVLGALLSGGGENSTSSMPGRCGVERPSGVDLCPDAMHQEMSAAKSQAALKSPMVLGEKPRNQ